MGNNV